jgi:hypothetical protein
VLAEVVLVRKLSAVLLEEEFPVQLPRVNLTIITIIKPPGTFLARQAIAVVVNVGQKGPRRKIHIEMRKKKLYLVQR